MTVWVVAATVSMCGLVCCLCTMIDEFGGCVGFREWWRGAGVEGGWGGRREEERNGDYWAARGESANFILPLRATRGLKSGIE